MAARWSRSSTESHCREDGAEEASDEARSPEDENRSPPSQASSWAWASTRIEEEGGMKPPMGMTEEAQTQLATRIPKELHRRLRLYCVTHDIVLMHFVTEAVKEKLARQARGGRRTRSEGTS